jgi:hypothetical protein
MNQNETAHARASDRALRSEGRGMAIDPASRFSAGRPSRRTPHVRARTPKARRTRATAPIVALRLQSRHSRRETFDGARRGRRKRKVLVSVFGVSPRLRGSPPIFLLTTSGRTRAIRRLVLTQAPFARARRRAETLLRRHRFCNVKRPAKAPLRDACEREISGCTLATCCIVHPSLRSPTKPCSRA